MIRRGATVFYIGHEGAVPEEGIVKLMCEDGKHAFVLYHTSSMRYTIEDLDHYTSARTALSDLYFLVPCI